ncbi:major capsid protein [Microbacterium binotii]|uniref:Phage capsid protein n=1 Tax=Microbacterium binotii TaxID=462710 RepID=A0ABN3PBJ5_9MICO
MTFTKDFRTPAQLTAAARAAFRAFIEKYLVAGLLPYDAVYDLDFTYGNVEGALPAAATYRAFNTESGVGELPAGSSKQGRLPAISQRHDVDEYLKLTLFNQNAAIGEAFEKRAIRSAQALAARVVLAAYEGITTGSVTIAENGMSFVVNFGRKGALTATAATAWSSVATAKPVEDLEGFRNIYGPLGRVILSQQSATYLQQNVDLIKLALGRGTDLPSRVSWEDVRSVFTDFRIGVPSVNEELVTNTSGVLVPTIAADKVLIVPNGQVGTTKVGIAAESINQENGIAEAERPGLFSGAMHRSDPEGYHVLVSGIVLPVVTSPDQTGVIDAF